MRRSASEVTTPGQRCVRVRTDMAAVPKLFDYLVPEGWTQDVRVGTRVRVELHGRRVGGWVVDDDVTPPEGVELRPLKLWSGWGPPPSLVELATWAAWRWAGPISFFLGVASPHGSVRRLPAVPGVGPGPGDTRPEQSALRVLAGTVLQTDGSTILRLAPSTDLIDLVLAVVEDPDTASRPGGVLVLVPSVGWAERLCARLVRRGYPATTDWAAARAGWPIVVGSRAAAWAPLPSLAAALVLDAHDESYREESAPTYSAVEVVTERARRDGCPCILTSPCPPVVTSSGRVLRALPVTEERGGVVDDRKRGSAGRRPAKWDVLRGVRRDSLARYSMTPARSPNGDRWCASTIGREGRGFWPVPTAASWRNVQRVAPRWPNPRRACAALAASANAL